MIRLRCPGGRCLALVMLAAVLLMVVPAAPVGAQVLEASWLLPAASLPAAADLLPGAGRMTCDPLAPWRNRYDYVSCVAREALAQVAAGSLTITQGQALIRRAVAKETDHGSRPLLTRRRQ